MKLTKKRLWAAAAVFLLLCGLSFGAWRVLFVTGDAPEERFSVRFLNVGQGDCTLICSRGRMALVDTGPDLHADRTVTALKRLGVRDLELVILSHGHEDHAGALDEILAAFPVGRICAPAGTDPWLWEPAAEETAVTEVTAGWHYELGEADLTALYPTEAQLAAVEDDNDGSLMLRVEHESGSFWLAGDCTQSAESTLLASGAPEPVTVLKASHHGSRGATSAALLNVLRPAWCVISCGGDNEYGHPHRETLQRLELFDAAVLRTDQMGTVAFIAGGDGLSVHTEQ